MAKKVMTVLGPIAPEELGFTSIHEHVLMDGRFMHDPKKPAHPFIHEDDLLSLENIGPIKRNNALTWDAVNLQDEERMLLEVADYKATGGRSMVECSAVGIRVNTAGVKRIAEKTGVHIIQSTGFYMGLTWPEKYKGWEVAEYEAFIRNEVENGVDGTDVLPGALKIAMGSFDRNEARALRAAARVGADTGMCLQVHPCRRRGGLAIDAVRVMLEEGMSPEKIIIAHAGSPLVETDLVKLITDPSSFRINTDFQQELLDAGVSLSIEFYGNLIDDEMVGSMSTPDWVRLALIYQLVQAGYSEQIVLGCDICTNMCTRRGGGEGYLRLTHYAVPTMRKFLGFSERLIDRMLVDNPARLLAF